MYIATNRKINESTKGLDIFGSVPNEQGPNELRLVKVAQSGTKYHAEVLTDRLTEDEVSALNRKYKLEIDISRNGMPASRSPAISCTRLGLRKSISCSMCTDITTMSKML